MTTMIINPKEFDWTPPTTNIDGSSVTPGELTGVTIGIRSTTAAGSLPGTYPIQIAVVGPTLTKELLSAAYSAGLAVLKPDTYMPSIREESVNGPSAWLIESAATQFQIVPPVPNPPSSFTVV
jgi:hypothetical protein